MAFLVDTNVLLRLAVVADPLHSVARDAVETLISRNTELLTSSQNLIETSNVATRPRDHNGLGQTVEQTSRLVQALEQAFPRLADSNEVYHQWRKLVVRFGVSGVQVHDARLVALMVVHRLDNVLTFNARDFKRYAEVGIRATNPHDVEDRRSLGQSDSR